jgi:hypothetical protein
MDPLGLAHEHFDASGAWRGTDAGDAIDASGQLPGGTAFDGLPGLRSVLLSRREQYVENVTARLLSYALGRTVEYYDLPTVRRIRADAALHEYRWSAIIAGIVNSEPFRMRRSRDPESQPTTAKTASGPEK